MANEVKWALVTGGSRGLGFETARALVASGYRVLLVARDPSRLSQACNALNTEFASRFDGEPAAFFEAIDFEARSNDELISIKEKIDKVVKNYSEKFGLPEILMIAHAVMSAKMSKTLKTDESEWRRVMSINLDSVFLLVNRVGSLMADARSGRIVIYSACLGRMSGPGNAGGLAPYRISKSGVNALVRNLAHETGHGSRGVLVDAICPNHSRTDMGGDDAPRSAAEGAATAVWLATREFTPGIDKTGLLWEDNQVVDW
jgi:3-oxoacyl-[acyl-carrier protein] reductase